MPTHPGAGSGDGGLLLASTSAPSQKHAVFLLDPDRPGIPRVRWALVGSGTLALRPSLTERELSLPLRAGARVQTRFIPIESLASSPSVALESCL
jgi:hypothetical protein